MPQAAIAAWFVSVGAGATAAAVYAFVTTILINVELGRVTRALRRR